MESFYSDRPLNFAHRGASHDAPANTLAAFALAHELGADGVELDVQLCRDGHLVVIHDFALAATTDGLGLVRDRNLAELKQLDAGSWFAPSFVGERIPTLQEVIDAVGHHLLLNIELKTTKIFDDGLARAVVHTVEENQLTGRVVLSSFNPLVVWRIRRLNPWVSAGLLSSPDQPLLLRKTWLRHVVKPSALHPHHTMVKGNYVNWARERGYGVHVWTVDEPDDMQQLMRQGVDIIITNRPDLLRQVLDS